ncbi:MAG: hypothetical protein ACTHON_04440 [Humibacter sp.]
MDEWLPSERRWLDRLAERTLDGNILLVRALPRWGIAAACLDLVASLGESAVIVDGRAATEQNQKLFREGVDRRIAAAIDKTGVAQLIFDNYGRAIRRSQGGTLHSLLYRLLVDSPAARDTGALLTARPSDMLDPGFSGSPLISRARTVALPALDEEDAAALDMELGKLRALVGDSTWLARRFAGEGHRQGHLSAVEHLNNDRRRIVEALPPGAVSHLAGGAATGTIDAAGREALMCLGSLDASGLFVPAAIVAESALLDEVHLQNPNWPGTLNDSARRFAELLAASANAYWIDRYIFDQPARVREFLDLIRAQTAARLRILTSDDRDRSAFSLSIATALNGIENVEVRFMHWSDRKSLHDRHLILTGLRAGYVLPTARVIVAVDAPGTAVAARIPAIDYSQYWARASIVFPAL